MQEVFIDIPDFVGFYQASNLGNIRSIDRTYTDKNGITQHYKGRTLKAYENEKGYLQIRLSKCGVQSTKYVHKLVAQAFLGECPEGYEVDHINRDNTDNRVENLRYVTHPENCFNRDNLPTNNKPVYQYTLEGEFISEYPSLTEAARAVGCDKSSIWDACSGRAKTAYGSKWKYAT